MSEIVFTCPKCFSRAIEEIMVDVTVASELRISEYEADATGPGGISASYGEQTNEGGHIERYQCGKCGYTILDDSPENEAATHAGALAARLKELQHDAALTKLLVAADTVSDKPTRPIEMGVATSDGTFYYVEVVVPADTPEDKLFEVGQAEALKLHGDDTVEVCGTWVNNTMDDDCPEEGT